MSLIPVSPPTSTGKASVALKRDGPIELHYELYGNGSNRCIFISGLSSTAVSYQEIATAMAATGKYTVLTFDNRCVGESSYVAKGFSVKDMATDALELLDHLGWKEDVFLMGVSMGGMICLELLLLDEARGRFAAAALVSTHAGGRSFQTLPYLSVIWRLVIAPTKPTDSAEVRSANIVAMGFPSTWLASKPELEEDAKAFETNKDWIVPLIAAKLDKKPPQTPEGGAAQMDAISRHYVAPERLAMLKDLPTAITVFHGTDDAMVKFANGTHIASHSGAKLEVFKDRGHILMLEIRDEFREKVLAVFEASTKFSKL